MMLVNIFISQGGPVEVPSKKLPSNELRKKPLNRYGIRAVYCLMHIGRGA